MANYLSLTEAKIAGLTNMTVLRNHVKNDDRTTTYTVNIDWFKFNNQSLINLYSSGNSWLGLGTNSELLKINRRDCAVWNEYSETGYIRETKFFKFTWDGYSLYNQTAENYHQTWDIFIFDKGIIYLNFRTIPTINFTGTNSLVCGSQTLTFSPSSNSKDWSFYCSDLATGTNWRVLEGMPGYYPSQGYAEYSFTEIRNLSRIYGGKITWIEDTSSNTSIMVQAKLDSGSYLDCTNGEFLPISWPSNTSYSTLYIKIELRTTHTTETPLIYDLNLILWGEDSKNKILLKFNAGNQNSFRNAVGGIIVNYNGTGRLNGEGGPVSRFSLIFYPDNLISKPNQNEMEHIEISSLQASGSLLLVQHEYGCEYEHLEITNILATASIIHINDL